MSRPTSALTVALLGIALGSSATLGQQAFRRTASSADSQATPFDPMAASRGPRQLLRNGLDYLSYQDYDKALAFLREAEKRKGKGVLTQAEERSLRDGLAQAQRGLREAVNTPRRRFARTPKARPGAIATARPTGDKPATDAIQLAGGTVAGPAAAAVPAGATRRESVEAPGPQDEPVAQAPAPDVAAPTAVPTPEGPAAALTPAAAPAAELAQKGDEAVPGLAPPPLSDLPEPTPDPKPQEAAAPSRAQEPPAERQPADLPPLPGEAATSPEPVSAAAPAPAPAPDEPKHRGPASPEAMELPPLPPESAEPSAPLEPLAPVPGAARTEPADLPPADDAASAGPVPVPAPASEPAPEPLPSPAPVAAPAEEVNRPARSRVAPAPAPVAPLMLPRSTTRPASHSAEPAASALIPKLTEEVPSTLSPELQTEVDRIARLQDDEARRNANQAPTGAPAPEDRSTLDLEQPTTRLPLPRPPNPSEARPLRAIQVPDEYVPLAPRNWSPNRKYWAAAATCHSPLYFQDASLERYGYSVEQHFGPLGRCLTYPIDDPKQSKQRNQLLQPLFSYGLFAAQIAALPYNMIVDPPWEAEYDLGYYRPGDRVPTDVYYLPWHGVGPPLRGSKY